MRTSWKKALSLLLALTLLLSFTACSTQEGGTNAATTRDDTSKTTNSTGNNNTDPTDDSKPTDGDTADPTNPDDPTQPHIHSYESVETTPTCTEKGYTTYTCACGDSYMDTYVDALGHDWDESVVTKEPTEEANGVCLFTCTVCGETKEETIPHLNHVHRYTDAVTAPTCTEQGYTTHTCACGDSYISDKTPAAGHVEETLCACDATCLESGLTEGKRCAVCGEVLVEQTEIPAFGHSEESLDGRDATCTENGLTEGKKCSVCGEIIVEQAEISAFGHTEETMAGKDATCTENGLTEGKICSVCDEVLVAQDFIDPLGHEDADNDGKCDRCEIDMATVCEHEYEDVVIAPTCTEEGYTRYTCIKCGYFLMRYKTPAIGHTEEIIAGRDATCTEGGLTEGKQCITCGEILAEQYNIEPLGHKDTDNDGKCDRCEVDMTTVCEHKYDVAVTEATCTDDGYTTYTCSKCGYSYVSEWITAAGHTWGDGEIIITSTCAQEGSQAFTCTVCGYVKTEILEKSTDHTFGGWTSVDNENHMHTCAVCGKEETAEHCWAGVTCSACAARKESVGLAFALNDDGESYCVTGMGECTDTEVVIPARYNGLPVTKIGDNAFRNCKLLSITIPSTITSIGKVSYGDSLSAVYIYDLAAWCNIQFSWYFDYVDDTFGGQSAIYCLSNPLYDAKNLYINGELATDIVIPDGVTSIGEYAFWGCSSLTSVMIPDSMTYVGEYAFKDCNKLIEVHNRSSLMITAGSSENGYVGYYAKNVYTDMTEKSKLRTDDNGYLFFEDCDTCYLMGYTGIETVLTLPENCNGKNYEIHPYAFVNCSSLKSITIPDGVTSIGEEAFKDCSSLTSITIPDGVTSIGEEAFKDCSSLTSITIPDSVTSIGDEAFYNCNSLTSVTIGNGVTSIGGYAFYRCSSLTSITIPDSVTSIGKYAFSGTAYCHDDANWTDDVLYIGNHLIEAKTSLSGAYTIPDSVTSIGERAFEYCSSLTSITISYGVTSIGEYAFRDCNSLTAVYITDLAAWCNINFSDSTSNPLGYAHNLYINRELATDIVIPDCVTSIGDYAFRNCSSLTSITVPDSVASIGESAFSGCISLTNITIGNGVTSIGGSAFRDCSSLTSITIPDSVTSIDEGVFANCNSLTSATIGDGVTSIGSSAFQNCSNLTSITIPDGVTSIGERAFEYCSSLTSITIPDGVTSIGESAFYNCSSLTSITIPDSVTSIGRGAFSRCSNLTSITIPDGVTSIGSTAFYDTAYYNDEANWTDNVLYIGNHLIRVKESLSSAYTIREGTKCIAGYAFSSCKNLTSITIPGSVMRIGSGAFSGCSNLTSITIPDSVTSIGDYTFSDCSSLTSITIPDSVTSIGRGAFSRCSSLTSITIPGSVMSIGYEAFTGCSSLTSVTIGNGVTWISSWAFYGCRSLTDIYFDGTMVQWQRICNVRDWSYNTGDYTVHCTDGDIAE